MQLTSWLLFLFLLDPARLIHPQSRWLYSILSHDAFLAFTRAHGGVYTTLLHGGLYTLHCFIFLRYSTAFLCIPFSTSVALGRQRNLPQHSDRESRLCLILKDLKAREEEELLRPTPSRLS